MEQVVCARCRTQNARGAVFCNGCGAALAAPTAPAAATAPSGWALATAGMDQAPPVIEGHGPLRRDEIASWWARLGASFLDSLLFMLVFALAFGALGLVAYLIDPSGISDTATWIGADSGFESTEPSALWTTLFVVLGIGVYVGWEVWWLRNPQRMARPGQSAAGFRVVRAQDLTPLTTSRSFGRFGGKLLYSIPTLGSGLTFITAFTIGLTEKKQAIHDMVGGTVCVRKSALARRGIGPDAAAALHGGSSVQSPASFVHPPLHPPPNSPLPPPPGTPQHGPFS